MNTYSKIENESEGFQNIEPVMGSMSRGAKAPQDIEFTDSIFRGPSLYFRSDLK